MTQAPALDFLSLQVRDRAASADFYERLVGLTALPAPNPVVSLFTTGGLTFAVRDLLPGTDLESGQPGVGIALWFHSDDTLRLHDRLATAGVEIAEAPTDGKFGMQFTFVDPDGYRMTVHSAA
ncbi:VOC family protein [Leucobacter musarum]|uniref:VOC family protein n=1 Tax=Leucobacter musarum TaxID=1930747 RepID=UPI0006A7A9A8|nr:VOC family protein [Leucobacter musarum]